MIKKHIYKKLASNKNYSKKNYESLFNYKNKELFIYGVKEAPRYFSFQALQFFIS